MRRAALVLAAVAALLPARAQAATVELRVPRAFGFFVGDIVEAIVDIELAPGERLQESSLPQPGPITTHLDLRSISAAPFAESGKKGWRLRLLYQNQFVALDVRPVQVPQLALAFLDGETPKTVSVPAWSFLAAPLREVAPHRRESGADYLQPDVKAAPLDESPLRLATALLAAASFAALLFYLRDRALWPFETRKARVFAAAARRIEALARKAPAPEFCRQSRLALHRSIDQKAGRAIHYEDIDAFLDARPEFRPAADELQHFFEASRAAFFDARSPRADGAETRQIVELAERLAALERAA